MAEALKEGPIAENHEPIAENNRETELMVLGIHLRVVCSLLRHHRGTMVIVSALTYPVIEHIGEHMCFIALCFILPPAAEYFLLFLS